MNNKKVEQVIKKLKPLIMKYARFYSNSTSNEDDLMGVGVLAVLENFDKAQEYSQKSLINYVMSTARNAMSKTAVKSTKHKYVDIDVVHNESIKKDNNKNPLADAINNETVSSIMSAINELDETKRMIFYDRFFNDMIYAEISTKYNMSTTVTFETIKKIITEIRKKFEIGETNA